MELDLLEERQDAARDAEPRMEAVVLYGVDTMSTKECMQYFGEYGPSFVEWINDSSRESHHLPLAPCSPYTIAHVCFVATRRPRGYPGGRWWQRWFHLLPL